MGLDSELKVVVAARRAFEVVFDVPHKSPALDAPWRELPKVSVRATPDDTLREILRRACDSLGIGLTQMAVEAEHAWRTEQGRRDTAPDAADLLVWADFRRPDDDELVSVDGSTILRRDMREPLTVQVVRDAQGRAVWRRPALEATLGELLDAASAGLLEGDPLQPYLIPSMPQGDTGALGAWLDFAQTLKELWDVTDAMATVGGAAGFLELLRRLARRRSKEALEAIKQHSQGWAQRGAAPADLFQFLTAEPRGTAEIAALLGCTTAEAEAILWAFGSVYDESSGLWCYAADPVGRHLGDDIDFSFADVFLGDGGHDRLKAFAESRLERLALSGDVGSHEETAQAIGRLRQEWLGEPPGSSTPRRWLWWRRRRRP